MDMFYTHKEWRRLKGIVTPKGPNFDKAGWGKTALDNGVNIITKLNKETGSHFSSYQ